MYAERVSEEEIATRRAELDVELYVSAVRLTDKREVRVRVNAVQVCREPVCAYCTRWYFRKHKRQSAPIGVAVFDVRALEQRSKQLRPMRLDRDPHALTAGNFYLR